MARLGLCSTKSQEDPKKTRVSSYLFGAVLLFNNLLQIGQYLRDDRFHNIKMLFILCLTLRFVSVWIAWFMLFVTNETVHYGLRHPHHRFVWRVYRYCFCIFSNVYQKHSWLINCIFQMLHYFFDCHSNIKNFKKLKKTQRQSVRERCVGL